MRKPLLFALGVGIALTAGAQTDFKSVKGVRKEKTLINYFPEENVSPYKRELKSPVRNTRNGRSFGRTQLGVYAPKKISSSPNCYGFLVSNSSSVVANKDLKTIVFANRGSAEYKPSGWNSGWIMAKISTDFGATWDSTWIYNDPRTDALSRYPTTMILNPAGNTDPTRARIVTTGPSTGGSGWIGYHQSSVAFDGSDRINNQYIFGQGNALATNQFPRLGGTSSGNKGFVLGVLEDNVTANSLQGRGFRGAIQNYISLDTSGNVTWGFDSIRIAYATNTNGEPQGYESPIGAWSADGQVGYIVFYGVEPGATGQNLSFQPLVWKTSDGGATWKRILYNYDWASTNLDEDYLVAAGQGQASGIYKPWFSQSHGVDALVDADGELHLFTEIRSGSSLSIDSAGYTWTPNSFDAMLFDVSTKTIGTDVHWCVSFVDLVYSSPSNDTENDYGDNIQLDSRLQITLSEDGTKIFYSWVDTDTSLAGGLNNYPDLFIKGRDLITDQWTETYMISQEFGNCYWNYASDIALINNDGDYVIPMTITEDNFAFSSTGKHNVNYVDNVIISPSAFTENNEGTSCGSPIPLSANNIRKNTGITVNPNPTSGATSINVSLPSASTINVNVYNALGTLVNTTVVNGVEGTNVVKINLDNLASGVYSYNVATAFGNNSGKIMLVK